MRRLIGNTLRSFGFELRRLHRPTFIDAHRIDLVLDVGANSGQYARKLRREGYRGDIVSFEPVSTVFKDLKAASAMDPRWTARCQAIGATSGKTTINVTSAHEFSSVLKTSAAARPFGGAVEIVRTETVAMTTVDEVMVEFPGRRTFLKIDTQGYDQAVIDGARNSLPELIGVLREVAIVPLYEGTPTFEEVVEFMYSNGFVLSQLHPVIYRPDDPSSLMEADCLFVHRAAKPEL